MCRLRGIIHKFTHQLATMTEDLPAPALLGAAHAHDPHLERQLAESSNMCRLRGIIHKFTHQLATMTEDLPAPALLGAAHAHDPHLERQLAVARPFQRQLDIDR